MGRRHKKAPASLAPPPSEEELSKPAPEPTPEPEPVDEAVAEAEPQAPVAKKRDPHEKFPCEMPDCDVLATENEMEPFVDPETGGQLFRCQECARKAEEAKKAKAAPVVVPTDAPSEALVDTKGALAFGEAGEDEDEGPGPVPVAAEPEPDDSNAFGTPVAEPEGATRDDGLSAQLAFYREENESLRRQLEEALAAGVAPAPRPATPSQLGAELVEATGRIENLTRLLVESRTLLLGHQSALKEAGLRIRDLEVLLAFDNPVTSKTLATNTEPWMLELASSLIEGAPDQLDEHSLMLLLVDSLGRGFMHRTMEAGDTLRLLVASPAGAALFALEEAARGVSVVLRHTPDYPLDARREAIHEAWDVLTVASRGARDQIVAEIGRIQQLEQIEAEKRRPKVPPPGAGRQFQVQKREPQPGEPLLQPPPPPVSE